MKGVKILSGLITTFLALLLLAGSAHAALSLPRTSASDFAAIDAYVQAEMGRAGSPGLAYAIVQEQQIVHRNAFGTADASGRAVTPATPFIIGSVGKTFTALAIRQLVHAGRIDPSAPVQRYIPWFRAGDAPGSPPITVQNLLDHKSGIPHWAGNQLYQLDERYTTEDLVRRANTAPLNSIPGTTAEYSNVNYLVLGLIIESVSGQSYPEYVKENVLTPLEMHHTYFDEREAEANGLASGYQSWYGAFLPAAAPYPHGMQPAGYSISSAEDLANYLVAYLNHGMFQGRSVVGPIAAEAADQPLNWYYDIYWNERPLGPNIMEGQSGGTLDFNGDIMILPNRKLGVVVLMNSRWTLDSMVPTATAASIADGVARRLEGWSRPQSGPLTFLQWYLLIDISLLVLAGFVVAEILRTYKWYKQVRTMGQTNSRGAGWPIVVDLIVAMGLLALPISQELALDYFLVAVPDIAIVLCTAAFILFLLALTRATLVIAMRQRRQAAPSVVLTSRLPPS